MAPDTCCLGSGLAASPVGGTPVCSWARCPRQPGYCPKTPSPDGQVPAAQGAQGGGGDSCRPWVAQTGPYWHHATWPPQLPEPGAGWGWLGPTRDKRPFPASTSCYSGTLGPASAPSPPHGSSERSSRLSPPEGLAPCACYKSPLNPRRSGWELLHGKGQGGPKPSIPTHLAAAAGCSDTCPLSPPKPCPLPWELVPRLVRSSVLGVRGRAEGKLLGRWRQ